jgi:hypothetical protein
VARLDRYFHRTHHELMDLHEANEAAAVSLLIVLEDYEVSPQTGLSLSAIFGETYGVEAIQRKDEDLRKDLYEGINNRSFKNIALICQLMRRELVAKSDKEKQMARILC